MILTTGIRLSEQDKEDCKNIYAYECKEFSDWVKPAIKPGLKRLGKSWKVEEDKIIYRLWGRAGLLVRITGAIEKDGNRWLHLSFTRRDRLPGWKEMVLVKELLLGEELTAIQVIPPRSQYVNDMENCLHLWVNLDKPDLLPDFRKNILGRVSI